MVYFMDKSLEMDDLGGIPYFRKPSYMGMCEKNLRWMVAKSCITKRMVILTLQMMGCSRRVFTWGRIFKPTVDRKILSG